MATANNGNGEAGNAPDRQPGTAPHFGTAAPRKRRRRLPTPITADRLLCADGLPALHRMVCKHWRRQPPLESASGREVRRELADVLRLLRRWQYGLAPERSLPAFVARAELAWVRSLREALDAMREAYAPASPLRHEVGTGEDGMQAGRREENVDRFDGEPETASDKAAVTNVVAGSADDTDVSDDDVDIDALIHSMRQRHKVPIADDQRSASMEEEAGAGEDADLAPSTSPPSSPTATRRRRRLHRAAPTSPPSNASS
ncbi:hypothetical protein CDCA_CDCA02G0669 [Cyanidium caldarium]|uniref:Chromosome segregation in meiosis protein 3 domain-containing protein n=1 Tax=Cyanidium caldarium TaxID=2771 RepID=A0AAV9IQP5_CYACA|nr:hypothetical protein CDCA_CDCA02G0669 [Cyanidium caldarium]